MDIIYRDVVDHIGQMKDNEFADSEVLRMEKVFPNTKWKKDYSGFLIENDFLNASEPIELSEGNCWVVLDYGE